MPEKVEVPLSWALEQAGTLAQGLKARKAMDEGGEAA